MTRFAAIAIVLAILASVFIQAVSGALEPKAATVCGYLMRAQRRETAAKKHAAQGNHVGAACCYTKAAKHCRSQALICKEQGDRVGTAEILLKAAAMHAIAHEQERRQLISVLAAVIAIGECEQVVFGNLIADYAKMDNHGAQCLTLEGAAICYRAMAEEHAIAGEHVQALAMNQAAAKQHETSAKCAQASRDYDRAAVGYYFAADRHAATGDSSKVLSMKEAEAEQQESHAVDRLAHGDHQAAVFSFVHAAIAYEAAGRPKKARSMNEAVARLRAGRVHCPAVQHEHWRVARYHHVMSEAYQTLGRPEKHAVAMMVPFNA